MASSDLGSFSLFPYLSQQCYFGRGLGQAYTLILINTQISHPALTMYKI